MLTPWCIERWQAMSELGTARIVSCSFVLRVSFPKGQKLVPTGRSSWKDHQHLVQSNYTRKISDAIKDNRRRHTGVKNDSATNLARAFNFNRRVSTTRRWWPIPGILRKASFPIFPCLPLPWIVWWNRPVCVSASLLYACSLSETKCHSPAQKLAFCVLPILRPSKMQYLDRFSS